ncbi:MAG: CPBP family intramembrane metalloprotease, partial [Candidatus Thermoplasmatota archaeon]|nr:CPBP family intramembrane metalloprotease [Candidatus Thermoplasmatota archaeon]
MTDYQQPAPAPTTDEMCTICGAGIPSTGNYCPRCGAIKQSMRFSGLPPAGNRRTWTGSPFQYQPVVRTNWRKVGKSISAFVMLTFVAQLLLSIVALFYGMKWVVPAILDEWHGFDMIVITPVIVKFLTISGYFLLVFYFFLIGAIVSSCTWVFVTSIRGFSKELSMTAVSREHSPLFETCGLLFATLFFSVLVALLFRTTASDVPSTGTLQESLFLLANASVWEELIVRVLLIGLPLLLVDFLRRNRMYKWHSYLLGGGFKIGTPEAILVVVSAAIFGYAHYAGGWGAWKIIPASAGGLAFGYLFLRFGLAASIMLHFATDYLGMPMEVFNSNGLSLITQVGFLIWLGFGVIFFSYYLTRIGEFLTGQRLFGASRAPAPTTSVSPLMMDSFQPPAYGPYEVHQPEW